MMKKQKLIAAVTVALVITGHAATITVNTVAPTVDGLDEANLTTITGRLKWFHDIEHDAGQTFLPGADAVLTSFTIQLDSKNDNDDDPNEWVNVRLGTITRPLGIFTFTEIYAEAAYLTEDWAAQDYISFNLDTPQALSGGVEYAVITDAQNMGNWNGPGIPYIGLTGNTYADGNAIGRGGPRGDDIVFHANLEVEIIPEPTTTALLGLGGLALILRRRK